METLLGTEIKRVWHTLNYHDEQNSQANGRREAGGAHRPSRDPPGHLRPHHQAGAVTITAEMATG